MSRTHVCVCVSDLDGLGGVGQALLHIVQQHTSQTQLVVFVQQPQQSLLILQVVLGLEGILPIPDLDLSIVSQGLGGRRQREGEGLNSMLFAVIS